MFSLRHTGRLVRVFEQRDRALPDHIQDRFGEIIVPSPEGRANGRMSFNERPFEYTFRIPITKEVYDSCSNIVGAYCPMPPKIDTQRPWIAYDDTSKYQIIFPPQTISFLFDNGSN